MKKLLIVLFIIFILSFSIVGYSQITNGFEQKVYKKQELSIEGSGSLYNNYISFI